MVARERGFGSEGVYECEAGLGAVGHGGGYGVVELDDGRWSELGKLGVEDDDAEPVGFGWCEGAGVAGGDLGFGEVGGGGGGDFLRGVCLGFVGVGLEVIPF